MSAILEVTKRRHTKTYEMPPPPPRKPRTRNAAAADDGPPEPLVKFTRHPLTWVAHKIHTIGLAAIIGHIGVLAVVGFYFWVFQNSVVKPEWDGLFHFHAWPDVRHMLRNVGEGFYGVMLAQLITWNRFKRKHKAATVLDRIELKLHVPNFHQDGRVSIGQLLASPLTAAIYAIPGFVVGYLVVLGIRHGLHAKHIAPALGSHPSFAAKLYASNFEQKVIGIFAGIFMGRRPMKPVFESIQTFFAERRIAKGKEDRAWHAPTYRAAVRYVAHRHTAEQAAAKQAARSPWVIVLLVVAAIATLVLAGEGYHVLHDIAS